MEYSVNIFRIQVIAIVASLILIAAIVSLIRKHRLREEYSLLLLGGGVAVIIFSVWRQLLDKIAHAIGIAYPPSMLFIVMLLVGVLIFLHLSVTVSELKEQNKRLTQEVSLLKQRIEQHLKQALLQQEAGG
ncbi:MAG: DUF2304 domain-containing protein [Deltaproteobacteria bacterium]|nr:DUF2304 domain-containing protein [Deltaproteobacteria bacterium]